MKKNKIQKTYQCHSCGEIYSRWLGKCFACGEWNTIEEIPSSNSKFSSTRFTKNKNKNYDEPTSLPTVLSEGQERIQTGLTELDTVLGGGLVLGSLVLIGGEPGVGKSTLVLEIARALSSQFNKKILYISGEESSHQISLRAKRMGVQSENIFLSSETIFENTVEMIRDLQPLVVFIDSIQTIQKESISNQAGSITQLRECTQGYLEVSKSLSIPIFLIGHITKDGQIAGPKLLEHLVDTVLYFEGDKWNYYRIIRSVKNRFGAVGEIAVFEMQESGLKQVEEKSFLFFSQHDSPVEGTVLSAIMEGSRAITVEVQALVTPSSLANARRMCEGLDNKRLVLICAVLEKYLQIPLSKWDVFANLAGGLYVDEPALDLAIASSIYSSYMNKPLTKKIAFLGEVGLSGEVRRVGQFPLRCKELQSVGVEQLIFPAGSNLENINLSSMEIAKISHIRELPNILI